MTQRTTACTPAGTVTGPVLAGVQRWVAHGTRVVPTTAVAACPSGGGVPFAASAAATSPAGMLVDAPAPGEAGGDDMAWLPGAAVPAMPGWEETWLGPHAAHNTPATTPTVKTPISNNRNRMCFRRTPIPTGFTYRTRSRNALLCRDDAHADGIGAPPFATRD